MAPSDVIITTQQQMAYAHPCVEAAATSDDRFHFHLRGRRHLWSVVLTANIGLE